MINYHLHYTEAVQFAEGFSEPDASVGYVLLGKSVAWDANDTPSAVMHTDQNQYAYMNSALGGKKITGNDVSLVISRRNWTANTGYTPYDDQANTALMMWSTANSNYVYTTTGGVYRCLSNANNVVSTDEPAGDYTINNGFIETSDGFLWKYLYTIPASNKFITSSWIPVPTAQGVAYGGHANNVVMGAISSGYVTTGGTGYTLANTILTITGNGTGATGNVNVSGNIVRSITMTSHGQNYTLANCTMTISGGGGSGATIRPIIAPYLGHGFNPARQLTANSVMIAVNVGELDATENNTITANNDFRQISIVTAIHKYGETAEVSYANSNSAVTLTTAVLCVAGDPYTTDEIMYQGTDVANSTFRSYLVDNRVNTVTLTEPTGLIQIGYELKGNTSGVSRAVVSVTHPEFDPGSGDVIHAENRAPVMRAVGQSEMIKTVVTF